MDSPGGLRRNLCAGVVREDEKSKQQKVKIVIGAAGLEKGDKFFAEKKLNYTT